MKTLKWQIDGSCDIDPPTQKSHLALSRIQSKKALLVKMDFVNLLLYCEDTRNRESTVRRSSIKILIFIASSIEFKEREMRFCRSNVETSGSWLNGRI